MNKLLFLIIFLFSIVQSSSDECVLFSLPNEILYKILHQLEFEERKNLLQTCLSFHKIFLDFILYEQSLEIKKKKATNFINNNMLLLLILDKFLEQNEQVKVISSKLKDKQKEMILYTVSNEKIWITKEHFDVEYYCHLYNMYDLRNKIDYLHLIGRYFLEISNMEIDSRGELRPPPTIILYKKVKKLNNVITLIADFLKYTAQKNIATNHELYLDFSEFTRVKNLCVKSKNNIHKIIFPDFIEKAVIKNPVINILFNVLDYEIAKKRDNNLSYLTYNILKESINHFYIKDLSLVVNDSAMSRSLSMHWVNALEKLPLERLKLTFYEEENPDLINSKNNLILSNTLKKLTLKHCNRPVQLPRSLEELYIIQPQIGCGLNIDNNMLNIFSLKKGILDKGQICAVFLYAKDVRFEDVLYHDLIYKSSDVLEKITIKNCPQVKTITIEDCKNLKKEHCFCDNPEVQWIFKNSA